MLLRIITSFIIIIVTSLLITNNPLTMGIVILILCLTVAAILSLILSSWYAILIFLIYIGGILVIFAYFVALRPNQQFLYPIKLLIISTIIFSIFNINNMTPPTISPIFSQIIYLYTGHNTAILIIIALTLLYIIVLVVKITFQNKGPLRAFI